MQSEEALYAQHATDHDRLVRLDTTMKEVRADVTDIKAMLKEQNGAIRAFDLWRAEQQGRMKGAATIGGISGGILAFLAGLVAKAMGWL